MMKYKLSFQLREKYMKLKDYVHPLNNNQNDYKKIIVLSKNKEL
jgi:hypothetical protein